jgi:glycogen debranching enzyme
VTTGVRGRVAEEDADLAGEALAVLDANWLGHATKPSPQLYPHQWSWDSAFIAMGYAGFDQDRAERELRSLFAGQWGDGLLPHIVFTDSGGDYFPGPEFWQTERSPQAPGAPRTSGIVQPPVHATAALRVYRRAANRSRATSFLSELFPRLAAWHEYLYRERTRGGALVEIWHPWESGMDNSPLWDEALARIVLAPDDVPAYKRIDVAKTDPAERPSDAEYDRYAYLVSVFRDRAYDPAAIRRAAPFAVRPVLFNSLLVQSNRDLAEIAGIVGADPAPMLAWADRTADALETMWDTAAELYVDFDVVAGEPIGTRSVTGYAPLYAGVPSDERARRMVERLERSTVEIDGRGSAVASLPPDDPRFEPSLYWRGPVWPILNWVLLRGLARYGFTALAARLRATQVELTRKGGFREHYSPITGRGQGGEQFAWTAALILDLLRDGAAEEGDAH